MIVLTIAGENRDIKTPSDIDESWITQQIHRRKHDGRIVCVQVQIKTEIVNVALQTVGCATGGGRGRQATPIEARVLELWRERGLNDADYAAGQVIAFLRQVFRIVG